MRQVFKRRIVRERVLQVLYAYEMSKENLDFLEKEIMTDIPDKIDEDFAHDLVNRVLIHCDDLDKMIKQRVNNWEMNRIALIDKILLRIGICELLYFPDIPPKVSINEVIEIAKVFSTAGSGKFINGILDAVLSELKNSGNLNKTGRGLLEESMRQTDTPKK
jgi:transcription antitermination protein NusB